nr:hypothetical protein TorRG33x02_234650 [Ipomoea batatas]
MYISWPPPSVNSFISIKSSYQVMHPIPPALTFAAANPVHEQFLRQTSSHSLSSMLMFTTAISVSGIFIRVSFANPSPFLHASFSPFFLPHPRSPSLESQSRSSRGLNPGKHVHSKSSAASLKKNWAFISGTPLHPNPFQGPALHIRSEPLYINSCGIPFVSSRIRGMMKALPSNHAVSLIVLEQKYEVFQCPEAEPNVSSPLSSPEKENISRPDRNVASLIAQDEVSGVV